MRAAGFANRCPVTRRTTRPALLALGSLAVALAVGAVATPATAKEITRFPLCDLEGHCDRHCVVATDAPYFWCGY